MNIGPRPATIPSYVSRRSQTLIDCWEVQRLDVAEQRTPVVAQFFGPRAEQYAKDWAESANYPLD